MVKRLQDIRKQIKRERGISFEPMTRKIISVELQPAPFTKSTLMRLLESRHKQRIDKLIYTGTIYQVGKKLGVSPSTVSKWRKIIDAAFFSQFDRTNDEEKNSD